MRKGPAPGSSASGYFCHSMKYSTRSTEPAPVEVRPVSNIASQVQSASFHRCHRTKLTTIQRESPFSSPRTANPFFLRVSSAHSPRRGHMSSSHRRQDRYRRVPPGTLGHPGCHVHLPTACASIGADGARVGVPAADAGGARSPSIFRAFRTAEWRLLSAARRRGVARFSPCRQHGAHCRCATGPGKAAETSDAGISKAAIAQRVKQGGFHTAAQHGHPLRPAKRRRSATLRPHSGSNCWTRMREAVEIIMHTTQTRPELVAFYTVTARFP